MHVYLYGIRSIFDFPWRKTFPSHLTNGFCLKDLFQNLLYVMGIQSPNLLFQAVFWWKVGSQHFAQVSFSKSFPAKSVSSLPLCQLKLGFATFQFLLCSIGLFEKEFWTSAASVLFISVVMVSTVFGDLFIPSKLTLRNCESFSHIPFWPKTAQWHWSYITSGQIAKVTRKLFKKTRWPCLQDCRKQGPSPFPPISSTFVVCPIPYNGCCWLEGQWQRSDPTSPPVHTELFGTFTFHRENIGCGSVVNLEAHSCVHLHRQQDVYEYNQIAISLKLRLEEGGWVRGENYLTQCIEKNNLSFNRELL